MNSRSVADDDGDVIGHFEFVKRADWPEREAAALRRERSSLALDRRRTRDSIVVTTREHTDSESRRKERADRPKDGGPVDRTQFSKDLANDKDARGRHRDRQRLQKPSAVPSQATPTPADPHTQSYLDLCLTPTLTSPRPYPSLHRSPSERVPIPTSQHQLPSDFAAPSILSAATSASTLHIVDWLGQGRRRVTGHLGAVRQSACAHVLMLTLRRNLSNREVAATIHKLDITDR